MVELDGRDFIILSELDRDGRALISQIAKNSKLNKKFVEERISTLEKTGFIKGYYTIIDASKLGYTSFRVYLRFQNTSHEAEEEILNWLKVNRRIWWLGRIQGTWDLGWVSWAKDLQEFKEFWIAFLTLFRRYIGKFVITPYVKLRYYNFDYLTQIDSGPERSVEIVGGGPFVKIDENDRKILSLISSNARLSVVDIAKTTKLTPEIVTEKIDKLKKNGVIQGFRAAINFPKLGYSMFKIDFQLNELSIIDDFRKSLEKIPNLAYIDETISDVDVEATFHFNSQNQLNELLRLIKSRWYRYLREANYIVYTDVLKYSYFPEA